MDPSSAQNQQIMSTQSLENMLASSNTPQQERKLRSQREQALKCPRCDSTNTKFCYYNNYSLSQPRYFCKSCKRYWTKGGTLRNVPVGGGCRKAKRSSSSSSSSSKRAQDQSFPHLTYDSSDALTLGFQKQSLEQLGFNNHDLSILGNPTSSSFCDILGKHGMNPSTTNHGLLLDTLRSGFLGTQNNNGHQNMYYVYGNDGDIGEVDNNGNSGMMMMLPYDREMSNVGTQVVRVSAKKQEQSGNRVYTNIGEVDSGIANWNGFNSSWHGLLHSSLI